jgi:predicted phage-related endonuclease
LYGSGAVELNEEAQGWLGTYRGADAVIAELEQVRAEARNHLEEIMGDEEHATVDGKPAVHWTVVESSRLNSKKLKEAEPDLYEAFTYTQVVRRFVVKP